METGVSEQPGQESVLDFLAVPVLRVEAETGRVLAANAAARALPFSHLLDVSRARNNHFDLDCERFELGSLMREVCERFTEQARHSGSELTLEDCPPVEVHWDRLRMEQALSNLITNAIKYGAGGPISVRAERRDGVVSIQVADRGIGVAEDDHERIFNPFERASSAHRVQSLGLGLYIVREIARAHGGTVGLTGRDSGGSCFTLRLPMEAVEEYE
jgi:signal transduction histidine kinase